MFGNTPFDIITLLIKNKKQNNWAIITWNPLPKIE